MATTLSDTVMDVQASTEEEWLSHETISKLAARLKMRGVTCLRILQSSGFLSSKVNRQEGVGN
jgi:hypothetical protein